MSIMVVIVITSHISRCSLDMLLLSSASVFTGMPVSSGVESTSSCEEICLLFRNFGGQLRSADLMIQ